jgi:LacI family transcriptional regulator
MAHITQNDIAKILSVSRITISKALRDHPDISADTKEKVRQVAEELGYIPNLTAASLHTRKSGTIGVVVPDVTNSFFSYAIHGIMDFASKSGYHIILTISRENADIEKENIKNLLSLRVDGLLVAVSKETVDTSIYKTIKKIHIPLIFFDRTIEDIGFSSIGIDDTEASSKIMTFAIQQGYNKFAHLAGSYTTNIGKDRAEGYMTILKKHHLKINESWIIEGGFDRASGYSGFKKILTSGELPEVIFAANDRIAQGAYEAIREAGLKIPDDIGVIAHGHAEFAKILSPTLTIIHVSPEELGRQAMKLLATHISSNRSFKAKKIILNTELIINKSLLLK